MPIAIYAMGWMIFSMTTSEFMVAGMMSSLAEEFEVSIAAIGYLISAYSAGMIVGGPLLTVGLTKMPRKQAFLLLALIFLAGQTLGALAPNYETMMAARIVTGISSAACFGVSLAISFELVPPRSRGRAASVVLGGLMIATALGLPASMVSDRFFGWRFSFWAVDLFVLLSGLAALKAIPALAQPASIRIRSELTALANPYLWGAYATSMLIIGATFAAFSYFSPILADLAGFGPVALPLILGIYGGATVLGNIATGRLADRYAMPLHVAGLAALTAALILFALFADRPAVAVMAVVAVGIVGVPMNPAMTTRIARIAGTGTLVTTIHGSVISLGVVLGSAAGGFAIDAGFGLASPLWVGAFLALAGLLSLLPLFQPKDVHISAREIES
ncbi:MFS transporter [Cohnella zeiphila]|uniref:MFS transporter n=1 Tax=Cohnella zeiphila TaxID=2761120 RepID=A0A7X0SHS6_9BACL|nr:MFS transporter [Cohnella zeiphila]MBB6730197.1 MFS transporter [Cohnella zeiphila]